MAEIRVWAFFRLAGALYHNIEVFLEKLVLAAMDLPFSFQSLDVVVLTTLEVSAGLFWFLSSW